MPYDLHKPAHVFMTVEGPTDTALRTVQESPVAKHFAQSEYDDALVAVNHERAELFTLLLLLEVPLFMAGLWSDEKAGWRDSRTGVFFSFDEMRQLIAARISELGLSSELVHSWPHETHSLAEDQRFRRLSFENQMSRFKR